MFNFKPNFINSWTFHQSISAIHLVNQFTANFIQPFHQLHFQFHQSSNLDRSSCATSRPISSINFINSWAFHQPISAIHLISQFTFNFIKQCHQFHVQFHQPRNLNRKLCPISRPMSSISFINSWTVQFDQSIPVQCYQAISSTSRSVSSTKQFEK